MRGVTSSSVAIADWRQLANTSAAARRQWAVTSDVHMVAGSSQTDTDECLFFKIPWFLDSAELYFLILILLQAEGGRVGNERVLDLIPVLPVVLTHG